jgi:hypothetical protein
MEQELENQESIEPEIPIDSQSVEDNQRVDEIIGPVNESETEKHEPDPTESSDTETTPPPDKSESEPQAPVDPEEQKSKLESDAENAPAETVLDDDVSEEIPPENDAEATVDKNEAAEKEAVDDNSGVQVEPVNTEVNDANPTEKRSRLSKLAFPVILMFVVMVVLLAYTKPWHYRLKKETQPHSSQPTDQGPEEISVASTPKVSQPEQNDPYRIYRVKLRDLNRLREILLLKAHEIEELKKHYRTGVKTLENEILQEALRNNIHTYQEALNNKRIELKIKAIQRRLGYVDKLDKPLKWLEQGSEELLYLKRKTSFDLLVVEIVDGIDLDMHMRQIKAALQKYRLTADNLAITTEGAKLQPLETLWDGLYSRTKNNSHLLVDIENWFIEQEICSGDLKRIGELSGISAEAARCIVQMESSDLFLNGIENLTPTIAEQLYQWKGKWICLNGVRILSPSAAHYLFQWEGEWISLNGLSAFPPELGKYLGQWKGKQLELMGLSFNKDQHDKIAFKYLAEWEKAGGKLFVPDSIRKVINMIKKI